MASTSRPDPGSPPGAPAAPVGLAVPAQHRLAAREARLLPGTRLAFADLHNHSHLSDGDGDARLAFDSMFDAGLDVAALTDHARIGWVLPVSLCGDTAGPCASLVGLHEDAWTRTGALADAADRPGEFVAMRGFEWTSPSLGHVNVWDSAEWIDALATRAITPADWEVAWAVERLGSLAGELREIVLTVARNGWHAAVGTHGLFDWLARPPGATLLGGGSDGLASFNHPGRDGMWFDDFRYDPAVAERVVAMEIFNRDEDYLFEGVDQGRRSPLVACLEAGWRVGLSGVTDEHGHSWGREEGLGRTGLWVRTLTRAGVREALRARRFYATRVSGLRLDAVANGARMGQVVGRHPSGIRIKLDLDRGPEWIGKPLLVQFLGPGEVLPTLLDVVPFDVPSPGRTLELRLGGFDDWFVLRVTDPDEPADPRAPGPWARFGRAIAYSSPFFAAGEGYR